MNWFERHLNWVSVLSSIIVIPFGFLGHYYYCKGLSLYEHRNILFHFFPDRWSLPFWCERMGITAKEKEFVISDIVVYSPRLDLVFVVK